MKNKKEKILGFNINLLSFNDAKEFVYERINKKKNEMDLECLFNIFEERNI